MSDYCCFCYKPTLKVNLQQMDLRCTSCGRWQREGLLLSAAGAVIIALVLCVSLWLAILYLLMRK